MALNMKRHDLSKHFHMKLNKKRNQNFPISVFFILKKAAGLTIQEIRGRTKR